MKLLKLLFLIITLSFGISCDEECQNGLLFGEIKLKVTVNDENPTVHVVLFKGRIENNDTLRSEYVTQPTVHYEVEAGRYYSATARYTSGAREILAIDGKTMDTTTSDDGCEYAEDITLNLRLAN